MPPSVDDVVVLANERCLAISTLERTLATVDLEVLLEAAPPCEVVVTHGAHKRSLTSVEALMLLELMLPHESAWAVLTLEGSRAIMCAHMPLEVTRLRIRQRTQLAYIRALTSVLQHVALQVTLHCKCRCTLDTLVGPFACVRPEMLLQVSLV